MDASENPYLERANAILKKSLETSERPTLLVSHPLPNDPHLRYVLCFLKYNPYHPYVSWYENMQDTVREGYPVYYEGDYCTTYGAALNSYHLRLHRRRGHTDHAAPRVLRSDLSVAVQG